MNRGIFHLRLSRGDLKPDRNNERNWLFYAVQNTEDEFQKFQDKSVRTLRGRFLRRNSDGMTFFRVRPIRLIGVRYSSYTTPTVEAHSGRTSGRRDPHIGVLTTVFSSVFLVGPLGVLTLLFFNNLIISTFTYGSTRSK